MLNFLIFLILLLSACFEKNTLKISSNRLSHFSFSPNREVASEKNSPKIHLNLVLKKIFLKTEDFSAYITKLSQHEYILNLHYARSNAKVNITPTEPFYEILDHFFQSTHVSGKPSSNKPAKKIITFISTDNAVHVLENPVFDNPYPFEQIENYIKNYIFNTQSKKIILVTLSSATLEISQQDQQFTITVLPTHNNDTARIILPIQEKKSYEALKELFDAKQLISQPNSSSDDGGSKIIKITLEKHTSEPFKQEYSNPLIDQKPADRLLEPFIDFIEKKVQASIATPVNQTK